LKALKCVTAAGILQKSSLKGDVSKRRIPGNPYKIQRFVFSKKKTYLIVCENIKEDYEFTEFTVTSYFVPEASGKNLNFTRNDKLTVTNDAPSMTTMSDYSTHL